MLAWACIQTWQRDYAPAIPAAPSATQTPRRSGRAAPRRAAACPTAARGGRGPAAPAAPGRRRSRPRKAKSSSVHTDVLDVEIDPLGGDLQRVRLPTYPVHKDQPDVPVELLSPAPEQLFLFHTGLRAADGAAGGQSPGTDAFAARAEYALADGSDELLVTLSLGSPGQVVVDKIYPFRRGRFEIDLEYRIRNQRRRALQRRELPADPAAAQPPERSYFNVDSYSFTGPIAYDGKKYEKLKVDGSCREALHPDGRQGLDRRHSAPLPGGRRAAGGPGAWPTTAAWPTAFTRSMPSARCTPWPPAARPR